MRTHGTIFLLSALLLTLVGGCQSTNMFSGQSAPADTSIVATFADQSIDIDEFEQRYTRTVGSVPAARADSLQQYAEFLDRYVNFRLKLMDGKRRGLDSDLGGGGELTTQPAQLAKSFLVSERRSKLLRQLYERRKEEVEISTIVVRHGNNPSPQDTLESYRKIHQAKDSIDAGMSFAEAALKFSDAPSVESDSGRVGWVPAGRAYQRFETLMYETPVGAVTKPFRSRAGYYLMKVLDRRPAHPDRRISHIMISPSSQDTTKAFEAIQQLRDSVKDGKDFARLARMYSAHRQTAGKGGDFGWMSYVDMHQVVPAFANAAWSMDSLNTVSEQRVRSRFGYHLIKITGERDYSSLEAARAHLEPVLENLPRSNNLERKVGRELLREHGYSIDTAVVRQAVNELPEEERWQHLASEGFGPEASRRQFASVGDSTYTLGQLTPHLEQVRQDTTTIEKVFTGVKRFMRDKAYAYVVPTLRENNPEFARVLSEYENGLLLFRVSEEVIWDKAREDTAALRELYEEIGSQYRFPRRHRTIVFRTIVDSMLKPVQEGLDEGLDISQIQERIDDEDVNVEIDTVFVADTTNQMYGDVIGLKPGEHSDMIEKGARNFVLYLDGIEEPRQKTFEEARTDLLREYQQRLEVQWIEELRDRYDVRLYPERLRYAFRDSSIADEPLPNRMPSETVSD